MVAEDVSPSGEGQVAGQDDGGVLVAAGDELEEQVRGVLLEGDVPDFVDLCRRRHKSTYADLVVMPMRREVVGVTALRRNGFSCRVPACWSA